MPVLILTQVTKLIPDVGLHVFDCGDTVHRERYFVAELYLLPSDFQRFHLLSRKFRLRRFDHFGRRLLRRGDCVVQGKVLRGKQSVEPAKDRFGDGWVMPAEVSKVDPVQEIAVPLCGSPLGAQ